MVFFVLMYSGHFFWMAYWKQLCAKPEMDCREKDGFLAWSPRQGQAPPGMAPLPSPRPPLAIWVHPATFSKHLWFLLAQLPPPNFWEDPVPQLCFGKPPPRSAILRP